jgi:hypothetical protein
MTVPKLTSTKTLLAVSLAVLLEALTPFRADGRELSVEPRNNFSDARAANARPAVTLTQDPLVMRMGKDEFRVAFGIKVSDSTPAGFHGRLRYRVQWKTEDGSKHWENREVGYTVAPNSARTITVDRQYFDTSEGAHATEVVQVVVTHITRHERQRTGPEG